jgi:hypothetical protein
MVRLRIADCRRESCWRTCANRRLWTRGLSSGAVGRVWNILMYTCGGQGGSGEVGSRRGGDVRNGRSVTDASGKPIFRTALIIPVVFVVVGNPSKES